jgi:hypothetical protein
MVLTVAQTTLFFEDAAQMAIPNGTRLELINEGINTVDDLSEFDKDTIGQIAYNLRRPPAGAPFVFGAKSQKRLIVACELVRYYETVGRTLSAANLQWNTVMKNFEIQWKALMDKKSKDEPETPKISKSLNIMKWSEAFRDILHRCIGVRNVPIVYVIRENAAVPAVEPPLMAGQPHSTEAGSVEMELTNRASHVHPLFREDNESVYHRLEEATRGTSYAASLKPYQRSKDGRGAFEAIISQYAGEDKWESELKKDESLLHTRKWKGQSNFPLEKHCAQHRNAFISMEQCAQHVDYQLPNQHSRVGYLLAGIENNDPGLQAAMAAVRTDKGPGGMRNNFEACVAHIVPYCPVAKKRTAGVKRGAAEISEVNADAEEEEAEIASFGSKSGRGPKTGVHLRYHKGPEYHNLSDDEKAELRDWRKAQKSAGKHSKKSKGKPGFKTTEKAIAAAVEKKVKAKMKALEDSKSKEGEAEAFIISCLEKYATGKTQSTKPSSKVTIATTGAAQATFLKSILQRAKNTQS